MKIIKFISRIFLASYICIVLSVGDGWAGLSTFAGQILNNIQLIGIAIQETENLSYTIKQYEIMAKNAKKLSKMDKQQAIIALAKLAEVVRQGQAVAYSSGTLDEDFRNEHKGYEFYENQPRSTDNHEAYSERYKRWAQSSQDSTRGALRAAGMQAAQFATESSTVSAIENKAESAVGMMQVLQASVSISAQQIEQMQKLRQLMMAQMQMQGNYIAGQVDRQAEKDAETQELLRKKSRLMFIPPLPSNYKHY